MPSVPIGPFGPPDPLRCGRCRQLFPGEAVYALGIDPGWWACDVCREALLGVRRPVRIVMDEPMSTVAPRRLASEELCWYGDIERRPPISRCPGSCNGAPTHAERQATGMQRFYCEAHAFWRVQEIGRQRLRALVPGELT